MPRKIKRSQLKKPPPLPELERLPEYTAKRFLTELVRRGKPLERKFAVYRFGFCRVSVGRVEGRGWHLFIAHPRRYPTVRELLHVRYELLPAEVTMTLSLGPVADGPPTPPNALDLWEVRNG